MSDVLEQVIALVAQSSGMQKSKLAASAALDQDIRMAGMDVWDFEDALADRFGEHVREWPWNRFANLNEGISPLFPLQLAWQFLSWPWRGSFEYPNRLERLELGHIAAVIEKGQWFEP